MLVFEHRVATSYIVLLNSIATFNSAIHLAIFLTIFSMSTF